MFLILTAALRTVRVPGTCVGAAGLIVGVGRVVVALIIESGVWALETLLS